MVTVEEIRIVTFNCCGLPWTLSKLPTLAERAAVFGPALESDGADVINLQEVVSRPAVATIAAHLPSYPYVVWRRGITGHPAGGLVTFARRPAELVSYTSFRGVSPTAGDLKFRMRRSLNSLLQGVTVVRVGDVTVANTHLTANKDGDWSDGNRHHGFQRGQLERLHRAVRPEGTAVLTGDFNIASTSSLYPTITGGERWHDPFGGDGRPTFHPEFLPPGSPGKRIDYALVRGGEVTAAGLLFERPVDGVFASDHKALAVTIRPAPAGRP